MLIELRRYPDETCLTDESSVSRLKMALLHSRSIVPCIQELQRIMGCAVDSMDTK